MQTKKIKLNATEDVRKFVRGASQCDFDVDVYYNRILIDAKSILGVLSMDTGRTVSSTRCWQNLQWLKTDR